MIEPGKAARQLAGAAFLALMLVAAIDVLTNTLDTRRFSWDFRYYIEMAERGFAAPMASPFAYRYFTPMLAHGASVVLGLPTEAGFAILARFGAVTQLLAVFLFARWYTRSGRGAWIALLVTAFSLYNVKFLLFDNFRPDHLAYPLILIQAYFALTGRFVPLLISTIIGCQIREFNAIPLVAYVYASIRSLPGGSIPQARRRITAETLISTIGLGLALALPRALIPTVEDFQFAGFTRDGMLRALLSPFILARDANFIYSVAAYALPVLMLASPRELLTAIAGNRSPDRLFLGAYTALVLVLSFFGGTDFYRFSAYLLVPQVVIVALIADNRSGLHLGVVLAAVFLFNRIWLPFPMSDVNTYLDFYGAFGTRFNWASVLRFAECAAFIVLGLLSRRVLTPAGSRPPLAPQ